MAAVAAIAETTTTNEEQLVTMIVDKQLFGIPILQVQDIVEATKITAVPLSPSAIGGMLNLRGRIVTVIDLRKLLGNDEEMPWESQMGVTVEHKGDLYTLLVDAIGDVRSVRRGDFDKAPSTLAPETRRLCSGIYRLQGSLLVVLDVSRILTPEVIGSTSVLTVAERKARKAAALEAGKGQDGQARQISSHMTGLSGYDAESERDAADQSADNIKQRKKENRNRRPVAERWREAMADRARKTGQTIYRMREPDEETLEAAQEEMAAEEAAWHGRIKDGADRAESGPDVAPDEPGALTDEAFSDEALPDMSFLDESGGSDEPVSSDEPASMDFLPEEALSDEPVSDEPIAGDAFAASDVAGIQSDDVTPPADESADLADPAAADSSDMSEDDPVVEESAMVDSPDMPVDESAIESGAAAKDLTVEEPGAEEPAIEAPAIEEKMTVDVSEMEMDAPVSEDVVEPADDAASQIAKDDADNGKSGMMSGLWSKLRGPDRKADADKPAAIDEADSFDEMPASDEAPVSDNDMIFGDEPVAEDKPVKKPAKSGGKAKPAAKKKKTAKRKSTKSDKS